jgi:Pycsar effector protein
MVPRRSRGNGDNRIVADPSTADIEFVIAQTADWIRSADTKTGLLFTGLTILVGAIGPHARDLRTLWTGHDGRPLAAWLLGAAAVSLSVAMTLLIMVLLPRTKPGSPTRFAWPWLATTSVEDLVGLKPDSLRREGWQQAKQLAGIAARKYKLFTAAVWLSAVSVAFYLVWSVVRG